MDGHKERVERGMKLIERIINLDQRLSNRENILDMCYALGAAERALGIVKVEEEE